MRLVRLLFSAVVLLVPVMLYAQTPPDSVMEVLRQKARPGMVSDYEANRKKHMAWHTAQKDPWTWEVFQIMTGPDTGGYVIASGDHQWKEMEDWVARFADADAGDSQETMGPNIASTERTYWTQLNAISRLPKTPDRAPLITVTRYHVKPGHEAAFRAAIGKVNAALDAARFPLATIWFTLANGGAAPTYALVAPRNGLGEMAPAPSLTEILEKQLGKPASDALVKSFFDNVTGIETELLRLRIDLSYLPN